MRKCYVEVATRDAARYMAAPGAITTSPRTRADGSRCLVSLEAEHASSEPWAGASPMNAEAARLLVRSAAYEAE